MKGTSGETENEEDIKCSRLRNNKLDSRREDTKNKALDKRTGMSRKRGKTGHE